MKFQTSLGNKVDRDSRDEEKGKVESSRNSYLRNYILLNEIPVAPSPPQVSQKISKSIEVSGKEKENLVERTIDGSSMNASNLIIKDHHREQELISTDNISNDDKNHIIQIEDTSVVEEEIGKENFFEHSSKAQNDSLRNGNLTKEEVESTGALHDKNGTIQTEGGSKYPFTFAGCLIVKDDNQLLPEWLAYHYTVMPLRHLIIAADPLSYTRVERVVENFRSIGMKIKLVTGNEYWYDGVWSGNKLENFDPKNHTTESRFKIYVHRQSSFYTRCLRTLHRQDFKHVMTLDTDEFFTYNQEWKIEPDGNTSPELNSKVPKHVGKQNETLAHWIDSGIDPIFSNLYTDKHHGCIVMPRVLVSPEESPAGKTQMYLEDGFNASYYNTILFQTRGIHKFQGMQLGKPLLNVGKYMWHPVENPHQPFKEYCFSYGSYEAKPNLPWEYSILVHHNIGSFESFASLNPLRKKDNFDDRQSGLIEHGTVADDSKAGWLKEFIELVGKEKALELTQLDRIEASLEDAIITERLRNNETVDFVYEWDDPKPEPRSMDEWKAIKFE